ncbi:thioredoxin reductase [Enterobacter ludwigii]|nr:thioredoxin reductase [Enterobacter ludwigii]
MNITCECVDMRTSVGPHNTIKVEMAGVVLAGTVKTRDVLPQLDGAEVIEWLAEQGYVITHQEHAA